MKRIIFSVVLMFSVCAGFAFAQTRRPTRRSVRRTPVRKPFKRKPIIKKPSMTPTKSASVTTESGLIYTITKKGEGAPLKAGDNIIVNYTGLLTNGLKFDSSLDRNAPFSFPLGAGMVIKGWDEGFAKLKIGDHAILVIPPSIGYGARGAGGVILPDATLIFVVEVLGVK